jgi:Tfp pilus assembly protein FimT
MKASTARKPAAPKTDAMTKLISASLRNARSDAVKTARMHRTPVVYLKNGKIVSERP